MAARARSVGFQTLTHVASGRGAASMAVTSQLSTRSCEDARLPSKSCERGRQASKTLVAPQRSMSKANRSPMGHKLSTGSAASLKFGALSPTGSPTAFFGSTLSFGSCHSGFGLAASLCHDQYFAPAEDGIDFDDDRSHFGDVEDETKSSPLSPKSHFDDEDGTKSNPLSPLSPLSRRARRVAFADEGPQDSEPCTVNVTTNPITNATTSAYPRPSMLLGRVGLSQPPRAESCQPEAAPVDARALAQAARVAYAAAALGRRGRRFVGTGASFVP